MGLNYADVIIIMLHRSQTFKKYHSWCYVTSLPKVIHFRKVTLEVSSTYFNYYFVLDYCVIRQIKIKADKDSTQHSEEVLKVESEMFQVVNLIKLKGVLWHLL